MTDGGAYDNREVIIKQLRCHTSMESLVLLMKKVVQCRTVDGYGRFGGRYCLQIRGCCLLTQLQFFILKMEAVRSSETSVNF